MVYGLSVIGITGVLFSLSIGIIVLGFNNKLEIIVACIIFSGVLWKVWMNNKKEGFQLPTGKGESANEIINKIKQVANKDVYEGFDALSGTYTGNGATGNDIVQRNLIQPFGLFSSAYVESFEDASPTEDKNSSTPTQTTQASTTGTAAPTNAPTATSELAKAIPTPSTSGFSDKLTDGMFKLGSLPPDAVGGSHIDIGTTMMNALNALKPDQIKQMTDDTRKLLETQKSLMGMLGTMKPMLQDGKQLMSTFNDMFGKGGNPMAGMSL